MRHYFIVFFILYIFFVAVDVDVVSNNLMWMFKFLLCVDFFFNFYLC